MPIASAKQLLLIKQLFDDACILAAREDDLSLTKALILLDLSVEQTLNQILRDFHPDFSPGRKDVGWFTLWQQASPIMKDKGSQLYNYRELASLRDVRNLAQHNASIPTQAEVKRYIAPRREMINRVFADAYQKDFDSFNVWEFISNEDLKSWLADCEVALQKSRAEITIAGCNVAHRLIISAIRTSTKLRRAQISLSHVLPPSTGRFNTSVPPGMLGLARQAEAAARQMDSMIRQGVTEFRKEVLREMEFLEDEVVTIGIGMPLMETRRFQKIGGLVSVSTSMNGTMSVRLHGQRS
ncbi:MAG TPA: hypothetical protein VF397_16005 [Pyrinomonadaceae bacterium]